MLHFFLQQFIGYSSHLLMTQISHSNIPIKFIFQYCPLVTFISLIPSFSFVMCVSVHIHVVLVPYRHASHDHQMLRCCTLPFQHKPGVGVYTRRTIEFVILKQLFCQYYQHFSECMCVCVAAKIPGLTKIQIATGQMHSGTFSHACISLWSIVIPNCKLVGQGKGWPTFRIQ